MKSKELEGSEIPPTLDRMLSWACVSSRSLSFCSELLSNCDPVPSARVPGAAEPRGKNAQHAKMTKHNLHMLRGSQSAEQKNICNVIYAGRHSLSPITAAACTNSWPASGLKNETGVCRGAIG